MHFLLIGNKKNIKFLQGKNMKRSTIRGPKSYKLSSKSHKITVKCVSTIRHKIDRVFKVSAEICWLKYCAPFLFDKSNYSNFVCHTLGLFRDF